MYDGLKFVIVMVLGLCSMFIIDLCVHMFVCFFDLVCNLHTKIRKQNLQKSMKIRIMLWQLTVIDNNECNSKLFLYGEDILFAVSSYSCSGHC